MDTGSIGPVTNMTSFIGTFGSFSSAIHGVLVSSILVPAVISSLVCGNVADIYGQPRTIMFGGLVFGIGAAIEASALSLAAFICGRVIAGLGEGFFLSISVVYICEISPAKRRGPLASIRQFATCLGLAVGYFVSYGTSTLGSSASWRLPLAIQSFLAFIFATGCTLVPSSPRRLLILGRDKEAARAAARLGIPIHEVELLTFSNTAVRPKEKSPETGLLQSIRSTFRDFSKALRKDVRKRTIIGCIIMAGQQLAGIDGVLYYAPLLFEQAGLASEQASFLASGVSAILILVATVPATLFSDRWGRRSSTIWGGLLMTCCMFLIGSLYASGSVHTTHGAARWVVIVTIYVFAVAYNVSWGIAIRIYTSEIQPIKTRPIACSLAQSSNWVS